MLEWWERAWNGFNEWNFNIGVEISLKPNEFELESKFRLRI